ncbi:ABC transporter ATP-binding protein [Cuniculiplasma divulgatum]|jgi:ABC-2 type transport system ATP-binding protein|uniref:ABC2-1 family ABC transporter ATPase n=1 Tax=Cuniculiplasma divulgatum TaxID=1673428 RepID=A0A1R4A7D4_9ARCH|nr:ABC transporter ATP-binding protein [Cuniculiplasma divulgatum]SJK84887.1 ABC2-1 family ABC transporter ATPase [Cuniculiplasma divulgatum]
MMELEAANLSKKYGNFYALQDFNLDVHKGECVALLGPNGAGKSTLLKISTNIIHPTRGTLKIAGINVQDDPMKALEKVGPLVELPEFYPYLNGTEILNFVCKVKGASKEKIKDEIERLSSMLKMEEFINKKSGSYSRGMKQRLALACSMTMDPELLILDEPTFGLDPRGMREFIEIIREINVKEGKTVILSTHLISEAREIADKVVIINHGTKMLEMKNERETNLMNVTFYSKPEASTLETSSIKVIEDHGNTVTIQRDENISNDDVIDYFREKNLKIRWIEPTNQIERKYLELIN